MLRSNWIAYKDKIKNKTLPELRHDINCLTGMKDFEGKSDKLSILNDRIEELEHPNYIPEQDSQDVFKYSGDTYIAYAYINKATNASKRGIEFSLTLSQWTKLMRRKNCGYTGVKLLDQVEATHRHKRTIDRIDSNIGYVDGNVIAVSYQANQLKNILFEHPNDDAFRMDLKQLSKFVKSMNKVSDSL